MASAWLASRNPVNVWKRDTMPWNLCFSQVSLLHVLNMLWFMPFEDCLCSRLRQLACPMCIDNQRMENGKVHKFLVGVEFFNWSYMPSSSILSLLHQQLVGGGRNVCFELCGAVRDIPAQWYTWMVNMLCVWCQQILRFKQQYVQNQQVVHPLHPRQFSHGPCARLLTNSAHVCNPWRELHKTFQLKSWRMKSWRTWV